MASDLKTTKDYSIFELHEMNRPLHEDPLLLESMKKHGFMKSSPMQVIQNGGDKLKVVRGHHRLHYAQRLGLPVWYVIDNTSVDIYELETVKSAWSLLDYATSRARSGDKECQALLDFAKKHEINLGIAASLLFGESAGSGNAATAVKKGTFKGTLNKHCSDVTRVIQACTDFGVSFSKTSSFIKAVSHVLQVPEFDDALFLHRVKLSPAMLHKRGTHLEYLDEIEALYNYMAKAKRTPLAFRAKEEAAKRHNVGYRSNHHKR